MTRAVLLPSTRPAPCSTSDRARRAPFRAHRELRQRGPSRAHKLQCACIASPARTEALFTAKTELLESVLYTNRGQRADASMRGEIEEKQVAVEAFSGPELDYGILPGLWRLVYTTALDVLPIIQAEQLLRLPVVGLGPFEVGDIYQRFGTVEEGRLENIIKLSAPFFLQPRDGVTITVVAGYEVSSPHRIDITFQEANVGRVNISPALEALIAPAMLPRGSLNHQLLLALNELSLNFPFRSAAQIASGRNTTSASYQLTYLDEDMLIGRASFSGGCFVFMRDTEL